MKKLQIFCLTVLLTVVSLRADTSYLLVQGPFGASAAVETFKWKIDYASGVALTGQDLLNAVFGLAVNTGTTYTDGFGATNPYYASGNSTTGAGYASFSGSNFLISLTLQGTTVRQDPSYSPGWNYYVAGGSGSGNGGLYSSSAWTYSNDGTSTRALADGSFDAFVFGSTFPSATISGSGNTPLASNFTAATPVSVPEPGSLAWATGALVLAAIRRRR